MAGGTDSSSNKTKTTTMVNRPPRFCFFCRMDISSIMYIRCADPICCSLELCLHCFSDGLAIAPHSTTHEYRIMDTVDSPLYASDWGADEEIALLSAIDKHGIGNWTDVSAVVGKKTDIDCEEHYYNTYLRSPTAPLPDNSIPFPEPVVKRNIDAKTRHRMLHVESDEDQARWRLQQQDFKAQYKGTLAQAVGYLTQRNDFEIEYLNDAEKDISDMEFKPEDTAIERDLKLKVLEIYNHVLDARMERKELIERYQILLKRDRRLTKEEREVMRILRPFARFLEPHEFDEMVRSMVAERSLRMRIEQLQTLRANGVRCLNDGTSFEMDYNRQQQVWLQQFNAQYIDLVALPVGQNQKMRSALSVHCSQRDLADKEAQAQKLEEEKDELDQDNAKLTEQLVYQVAVEKAQLREAKKKAKEVADAKAHAEKVANNHRIRRKRKVNKNIYNFLSLSQINPKLINGIPINKMYTVDDIVNNITHRINLIRRAKHLPVVNEVAQPSSLLKLSNSSPQTASASLTTSNILLTSPTSDSTSNSLLSPVAEEGSTEEVLDEDGIKKIWDEISELRQRQHCLQLEKMYQANDLKAIEYEKILRRERGFRIALKSLSSGDEMGDGETDVQRMTMLQQNVNRMKELRIKTSQQLLSLLEQDDENANALNELKSIINPITSDSTDVGQTSDNMMVNENSESEVNSLLGEDFKDYDADVFILNFDLYMRDDDILKGMLSKDELTDEVIHEYIHSTDSSASTDASLQFSNDNVSNSNSKVLVEPEVDDVMDDKVEEVSLEYEEVEDEDEDDEDYEYEYIYYYEDEDEDDEDCQDGESTENGDVEDDMEEVPHDASVQDLTADLTFKELEANEIMNDDTSPAAILASDVGSVSRVIEEVNSSLEKTGVVKSKLSSSLPAKSNNLPTPAPLPQTKAIRPGYRLDGTPITCICSPLHPGKCKFDISRMEGVQLLSFGERVLCSELHIVPSHYFVIKERIIRESIANGYITQGKARNILKIDINATDKILNMCITSGFINSVLPDGIVFDSDDSSDDEA